LPPPVVSGCTAIGVFVLSSYGVLFSTETARRVYSSRPRVCPHRIALRYCDGYRTRAMQLETA
jgi:hypothetical protein